jgi:hypothetical protein
MPLLPQHLYYVMPQNCVYHFELNMNGWEEAFRVKHVLFVLG